MKNNNSTNRIPTVIYINSYKYKSLIYRENVGKSGIYCWKNTVNGKLYIGSAKDLTKRLRHYFSPKYLNKELLRSKSKIYRALLKYNYNKFDIEILEYCQSNLLTVREQYYFDLLKPEYNILKVANSRLGIKARPETLLKYKDREYSSKILTNLQKTSCLSTKINQLLSTSHVTIIVNKENNTIEMYPSIRSAARDINAAHSSLIYCMKNNILLKKTYLIIRLIKIKY